MKFWGLLRFGFGLGFILCMMAYGWLTQRVDHILHDGYAQWSQNDDLTQIHVKDSLAYFYLSHDFLNGASFLLVCFLSWQSPTRWALPKRRLSLFTLWLVVLSLSMYLGKYDGETHDLIEGLRGRLDADEGAFVALFAMFFYPIFSLFYLPFIFMAYQSEIDWTRFNIGHLNPFLVILNLLLLSVPSIIIFRIFWPEPDYGSNEMAPGGLSTGLLLLWLYLGICLMIGRCAAKSQKPKTTSLNWFR